jgi:DNA-directed RNA polymerase specialized sigma24 family protein
VDDPEERFTDLYDRHYRSVLGYALLRTEHGMAEDVSSETFLIAWRRLDELPDPALPWLLGVARNLLAKQWDSRHRRQRLVDRIAALSTSQDHLILDIAEHVVDRETARRAGHPAGAGRGNRPSGPLLVHPLFLMSSRCFSVISSDLVIRIDAP